VGIEELGSAHRTVTLAGLCFECADLFKAVCAGLQGDGFLWLRGRLQVHPRQRRLQVWLGTGKGAPFLTHPPHSPPLWM
jgi:hypothetical protein